MTDEEVKDFLRMLNRDEIRKLKLKMLALFAEAEAGKRTRRDDRQEDDNNES